ncbi:Clavaminate synthase-like protein [Melanogaster broomeanus]|nr:Clavaminate synthase-like protein [Melanogaster broomeanus]
MPSVALPPAPHYNPAPPTKADLDYADLPTIDLAKAQSSEGRQQLASQVQDALLTHGFFYVVNHGYLQSKIGRMFDIADIPFSGVSDEEKQVYAGTMKQNRVVAGLQTSTVFRKEFSFDWAVRTSLISAVQHIDNGVRDQSEQYNINRDVTKRGHPEVVRPFLPEIREFARFNHLNILHPILRLIALSLELPEDALVNIHNDNAVGETHDFLNCSYFYFLLARAKCSPMFLPSYPRSAEEEAKTRNVWLKGHTGKLPPRAAVIRKGLTNLTDFGTITILWSQPVAALQIIVKGRKMALGGYYKGTIHRVVQPPQDQQQYTRLGLFYFALPDDNVKLIPMRESPVLQRVGINPRCEDSVAPTIEVWRKGRTSAYGQSELKSGQEKGVEEEVIEGLLVKHWN